MIIVYLADGTVVDNTGVATWIDRLPEDPAEWSEQQAATVERAVSANLRGTPRDDVDYIIVRDPDVQQDCLTHRHTVANGQVVVGEPNPEPPPPEPTERDKARERIAAASSWNEASWGDVKLLLTGGQS